MDTKARPDTVIAHGNEGVTEGTTATAVHGTAVDA